MKNTNKKNKITKKIRRKSKSKNKLESSENVVEFKPNDKK